MEKQKESTWGKRKKTIAEKKDPHLTSERK